MKYVFLGVSNAFFFVVGLWVGGILCGLHPLKPVEIVYPSPVVYFEGKRSDQGRLSPETINAIEIQTARELFGSKMRDPFHNAKKDKPPRQVCLEEQEMQMGLE